MNHPSRLALDRRALGDADPALEAHLASCPDCRAHMAAVSARLPLPEWLTQPPPRRTWWRPLAFVGALAAVALAVLVRPTPPPETAKGLPSVTVWVKHGAATSAWDGTSALHSGDGVRLEARPAGYAFLTVVDASGERPAVLFTARLDPEGKPTLTPAWQLDANGAREHLTVVFSRKAVDEATVGRLLSRRDSEVWCIDEVLPKEVP